MNGPFGHLRYRVLLYYTQYLLSLLFDVIYTELDLSHTPIDS